MPRLVARQCGILRGAHYAIGTLCRSKWLARPAFVATARLYATNSSIFDRIRPLNSAILIPSSVEAIQPDDLINYINPIPLETVTKDTFCVFLITPSFTSWLHEDDFFLAKAIRRAYSKAFTGAPGDLAIHTLCAVVDKLPAGRAFKVGQILEDVVAQRSIQPPVAETGFEGIAFATLPTAASIPSTSPRSSDKGAIDFIFSGQTVDKRGYSDTWRLPLANTVFQTGSPTTMFLSKWRLLCERSDLGLEKKTDISHHGLGVAASLGSSGLHLSALSVPLLPLTLPRRVQGCMGNIIRRVVGPEKESVSASSELERVVPQFFKARGEPARPTAAWALVIPRSLTDDVSAKTLALLSKRLSRKEKGLNMRDELWERLWCSDPPGWNKLVPTALAEGARLHRVLSGGGGWGKKAGLLSLDPVPVSEEIPIRMEDATSAFDGPGDFKDALTPVVQDGDAIQFFISPASNNVTGAGERDELEKLKALPKERAWGWELGTIPSTVDSIPGGSWQHTDTDSKYIAVFRNSFGALAESGMTLTRRLHTGRADSVTLATTTVDVPYTRLWMVELDDKRGSTKDLMFASQVNPERFVIRSGKQLAHYPHQVISAERTANRASPPALIRRVLTKGMRVATLASDRLRWISQAITQVTEEYKTILYRICQRQRRANTAPTTALFRKVQAKTMSISAQAAEREHRIHEAITQLSRKYKAIVSIVHQRQRRADAASIPTLIRRLQTNISRSATAIDRVHSTSDALIQLAKEHEAIICNLHQRQRRNKTMETQHKDLRHQRIERALEMSFEEAPESTKESAPLLSAMQAEVDKIAVQVRLRLPSTHITRAEEACRVPICRNFIRKVKTTCTAGMGKAGEEEGQVASQVPLRGSIIHVNELEEAKRAPNRTVRFRPRLSLDKTMQTMHQLDKEPARLSGQYAIIAHIDKQRKRNSRNTVPSPHNAQLESQSGKLTRHGQTMPIFDYSAVGPNFDSRRIVKLSVEGFRIVRSAKLRRLSKAVHSQLVVSQAKIIAFEKELGKNVRVINRWGWYIDAANMLALETYGLHMALRTRLSKMIYSRQKSHKSKLELLYLESRLLKLRTYDDVLFSHGINLTSQQISERLLEVELSYKIQHSLVIDTPLQERLREERLEKEQRSLTCRAKRERRGLTGKTAFDKSIPESRSLRIRYNRLRGVDRSSKPRVRRIRILSVRKHRTITPVDRRVEERAKRIVRYRSVAHNTRAQPPRQRARPRPSVAVKRRQKKEQLLRAVGSWLGTDTDVEAESSDSERGRSGKSLLGSEFPGNDGQVSERDGNSM